MDSKPVEENKTRQSHGTRQSRKAYLYTHASLSIQHIISIYTWASSERQPNNQLNLCTRQKGINTKKEIE
jgi:hypothetical protein